MRYLLDTHIVMWALANHPKLKNDVRDILLNPKNEIYYSVVSPWEVEIKHLKDKERFTLTGKQLSFLCEQAGFINININTKRIEEIQNVKTINNVEHNDPFDKMLLAQARSENMILITHDKKFKNYLDSHLFVC